MGVFFKSTTPKTTSLKQIVLRKKRKGKRKEIGEREERKRKKF